MHSLSYSNITFSALIVAVVLATWYARKIAAHVAVYVKAQWMSANASMYLMCVHAYMRLLVSVFVSDMRIIRASIPSWLDLYWYQVTALILILVLALHVY
jgi:hypothetical protein